MHCAGLFLASLALHMAAPAGRFMPEPLAFAIRLLRSALGPGNASPDGAAEGPAAAYIHPSARLHLGRDNNSKASGSRAARKEAAQAGEVQPLRMSAVLAGGAGDACFGTREFRAGALGAAIGVVVRAAEVFGGVPALPEVLAPARAALEALGAEEGLPEVCPIQSETAWAHHTSRCYKCQLAGSGNLPSCRVVLSVGYMNTFSLSINCSVTPQTKKNKC